VSQKVAGATILQAADLGVADYNAVVCAPETLQELAGSEAVRSALATQIGFADILFMRKVTGDAATLDRLFSGTARSECENKAYVIDLKPGEFEAWRKENLKKGFRKNIDRRRRKLEGEHGRVGWKTFTEPGEVEAAMTFIRAERTRKFKDDILAGDAYFGFYLACALAGAKSGETITSGMVVDGRIVSADFGVMGKDCLHSILCAADVINFGPYAPGLQSLHDLIWERSDRGDIYFDAGLGNSGYKSDFAAREIPLQNLSVSLSPKGQAISAIYHRAKPLKNLLRNLVKAVR
jgi:CelD/BcsL family acetyltransferase involved in cellulose biosynthesis